MTALTRRLERLAIVWQAPKPLQAPIGNLQLLTDAQLEDLKRLSLRHLEVGLDGLSDDELDELLVLVETIHGRDH